MSQELLGESSNALMKQAASGEIGLWTDEKKKDFVATFEARAKAGRWILLHTADIILETAHRRQFISDKHLKKLNRDKQDISTRWSKNYGLSDEPLGDAVGGRTLNDLTSIARERAELVLSELPPLKKAVRIIDAGTADKIERKEKIVAQLRKLKEQLEDDLLAGPIRMSELDQKMTIGEFRKMVSQRVKTRKDIFRKMDDLAVEGTRLENEINKSLYKGLPGLSDAVLNVAQRHYDRATALDEMTRRVGERVMFGDSEAAMEMLKSFEKDEQTVPEDVKAEFKNALEKLRVSKKQLGTGRKKK